MARKPLLHKDDVYKFNDPEDEKPRRTSGSILVRARFSDIELYETLGITREADMTEIRRAYKKKAKKYHPDRNPGDPNARYYFDRVTYAYAILSSSTKKRIYDKYGIMGLRVADTFGDHFVDTYFITSGPCFKFCEMFCFIATGCCCCMCCCMCCNFCCNVCNTDKDKAEAEAEAEAKESAAERPSQEVEAAEDNDSFIRQLNQTAVMKNSGQNGDENGTSSSTSNRDSSVKTFFDAEQGGLS